MKALKVVALVVLGFLLFISLSAFGLAFSVSNTVLNKSFLPNEVDRLDLGPVLTQAVEMGASDLPPDIRDAVVRTATSLQPQVKAQFRAADYAIYAYLLGETNTIDLSAVLKATILNRSFIASVANEADVLTLARQSLRNELADLIPPGQQQLVVYLDHAMPSLDPWLKQQIDAATGPVVDYLVGDSSRLNLSISLAAMKTTLRDSARSAFLRAPPPQLAGTSQAQLDVIFNQYYDPFAAQIPSSATIDPSTLGLSSSTSMAQSLSDAEAGLARARTEIGRFRLYYILLMIVILVLVLGIALIHHEVKAAARDLGIIFLIYGFLEFIGALVSVFVLTGTNISGLPEAVQSWLPRVYRDIFRPIEILSGALAIIGLGLIICSAVYRRRNAA